MKIFIASDHRGFALKNKIKDYLNDKNIYIEDCGAYEYKPSDDYVDFVSSAMEKIKENPDSLAIVLCKNGGGVSITANKFKGIRCAISFDKAQTESLRLDDDINVLAIPASFVEEQNVFQIIDAFLTTKFSNEKRHIQRLNKISTLESKNFKE